MITGILMVNLEPSYIGFSSEKGHCWRYCTADELRGLLTELGIVAPEQAWPPREYMLRVPGNFSSETLLKFGLVKPRAFRCEPSWNARESLAVSA